jgi:hypothetical protein
MKKLILNYILALLITVIVYGAIPFVSIPTLGQIVWTSGFAQSFINAGWPAIKAINFGIPVAAPIPFGLSNAFLQSGIMYLLDLPPWDAYALAAVIWLGLGLFGCSLLARLLGMSSSRAPWVALIYMTLPIIWWHATYCMLSFGFALLPLYVALAFKLIYRAQTDSKYQASATALAFILVSCLAVFMDGYTYVMFFTAVLIIYITALCRKDINNKALFAFVLPIIILAAAISYLLYIKYLEISSFSPSPIDFFRSYGVDVVMLLIPSQGVYWLWDMLNLSVHRSGVEFFGDPSVWSTTFALPLLVLGGLGFSVSKANRYAVPLLLIALVGLYFALGPSLKIDAVRPAGMTAADPYMPPTVATISTGSALIYQHLPGFMNTRAAYRWAGLMFVGLYGLTILLLLEFEKRNKRLWVLVFVILIVLSNLPHLRHRLKDSIAYRHAMQEMTSDLQPMNDYLKGAQRVVFYPQVNDFIVNYLASVGHYDSYNVGGDKNIEYATEYWPQNLKAFLNISPGQCPAYFQQSIVNLLNNGVADYVVLPYFDTLWNAHEWPPSRQNYLKLLANGVQLESPGTIKAGYANILSQLSGDTNLIVKQTDLYAIISLKNSVKSQASAMLPGLVKFDVPISFSACSDGLLYLNSGWSPPEFWGTWSGGASASLLMRVPSAYLGHDIVLSITGHGLVGGTVSQQNVDVYINDQYLQALQFSGADATYMVQIPKTLIPATGVLHISFKFKNAISPSALGLGGDPRVLALGLVAIKLSAL